MLAPRTVAAAFGLLAFSITILAGLWVRNPAVAILSRAIWAMVIFAVIGLATGWAARTVVREHIVRREKTLFSSAPSQSDDKESLDQQKTSTPPGPEPMRT